KEGMRSLFESNASTNKTIAQLCELVKTETISHEGNDDPAWAEHVVKTLAKRLKKAKYLDELAKAIINEDRHSSCCAIPSEVDKKKSVGKDRSHLLYIKMWRFPWLRSHRELKAVENCRYPFSKKADLICINPYHYEPIHAKAPPLPPVVVNKRAGYYHATTATISALNNHGFAAQSSEDWTFIVVQELIEYCEPECWMSITYYEEGKRIGDPFNVRSHYLLVDGYPSPSSEERFCLGYFDVENRPIPVIDARRQVGRGARFYYIGGEVYCECLSDAAVFVQSPNCNQRHGWHPTTVCKIPPNCNLKIFNNAEFAVQLAESVEKGYEAVYALTRLCTIRISFVKGWGADYRRQTIDATPCWIEAHLNGPLLWIDRVLRSMGAPMMAHSSFT
ncbi:Mothers against decapentaplegic, partial [Trichostrongylus colubriformis]